MDSVLRDIRYGFRSLRTSPTLTAVAVFTLALGIGLTATMFSIVYGALRGLPYEQSERIMHLERNNLAAGQRSLEVSIHDYLDWRAQQRSFESLAAFYNGTINLSGTEKPERFDGAYMTANAFRTLRVRPLLGRDFREGEDRAGAPLVVILGYRVWKDRYAGDPNIVGTVIRANGEPAEIIGVMPEDFAFPISEELWVPLRLDPLKLRRGQGQTLEVYGRLREGVTQDQAMMDLNAIAKRLAADYPKENEGVGANIKPYTEEYIDEEPRTLLFTMLGAVSFVLLIACVNVANLLLGRAAFRSKEVGIRTALGASRRAVILQFLTESFILSVVGAALGVGIAVVGVRLFNDSLTSTTPPFWIDIKVDPAVLLFVLGTSVLATLVSGLVPAIQASRVDINEILKDETRGSSSFRLGRMSKALVVFEMALSCGLLVAAGLTIKSVTNLRHVDFGFPVDDIFTARVGLFEAAFPSDTARIQFAERLVERAAALPGASEVAVTSSMPGLGFGRSTFAREGATYQKQQDYPQARVVTVSPGFFPLVRARALEGRLLGDGDRMGTLPVAVVNERFARKFFKGESSVGQRVRIGGDDTTQVWRTIVGVVPDRRAGEVDDEDAEGIYVPVSQNALRFMSVMIRTRGGDPNAVAGPLRDAVQALDRDTPIYFAWSMREAIARPTWFYRVFGTIFMIFGVVALFLAGVGLYGVMAFSVSRRTREVGVRMALGAQGRDVVNLIFRQGLGQIAVGMLFGLALAAGLSRFLQLILFDVRPRDPAIFGGVVLVLTAVGVLACLVPARRATRVDPMVALRAE